MNYTRGWSIIALAAVTLLGVGTALYLSTQPVESFKFKEEWVKALLQAGLIAVLGVVTTSVLETFKDSLQRKRDQSKIRFDFLAEVGRIYMDVKLIRRRAQAANALIPADIPDLNELQVRLELHKKSSVIVFDQGAKLKAELKLMEQYLDQVANESGSTEHLNFLGEGFKGFSTPFHKAQAIMHQEISGNMGQNKRIGIEGT